MRAHPDRQAVQESMAGTVETATWVQPSPIPARSLAQTSPSWQTAEMAGTEGTVGEGEAAVQEDQEDKGAMEAMETGSDAMALEAMAGTAGPEGTLEMGE